MLIGRQDSKIDEKNRISFPKKFRKELGDNLVVTQGFESSLIVISVSQFDLLLEGTKGKPIIDKEAREIERFLLGNASEVELDSKGRFILPMHLKEYAGLSEEVSCLGIVRYVQIWDKKRWDEHNLELTKTIEPITEKLNKLLNKPKFCRCNLSYISLSSVLCLLHLFDKQLYQTLCN